MLKKMAVISLVAGAALFAAPSAATAASDTYADTTSVTVDDPIIDLCDVSTITFGPGSFAPGEVVGVSVSGLDAARAQISGNTAAADGSLTVSFRPPAGGSGAYAITFTSASGAVATRVASIASIGQYTAVITVDDTSSSTCDRDPGAAAAGTEMPLTSGGGTIELALTGGGVSPWIVGGGAAALILGGGLVAAGVARRTRAEI